jgi:hypothetical protein
MRHAVSQRVPRYGDLCSCRLLAAGTNNLWWCNDLRHYLMMTRPQIYLGHSYSSGRCSSYYRHRLGHAWSVPWFRRECWPLQHNCEHPIFLLLFGLYVRFVFGIPCVFYSLHATFSPWTGFQSFSISIEDVQLFPNCSVSYLVLLCVAFHTPQEFDGSVCRYKNRHSLTKLCLSLPVSLFNAFIVLHIWLNLFIFIFVVCYCNYVP